MNIKRFEQFPKTGGPLINVIDIPKDYMYFVLENNCVFYRLEKETVKIIRIIDTRHNYIDILLAIEKWTRISDFMRFLVK